MAKAAGKRDLQLPGRNRKGRADKSIIHQQDHFFVDDEDVYRYDAEKVEEAVNFQITTELLSYELRNALENLGEISGEFTNDEVLGNIFSKFCIGK